MQLASALAFLRKQNLIHRDLKPANIMVSSTTTEEDLQLKIIDFGSAEKYTKSKPARAMALSGTRCYWPPEVLERQETSPAMDMWALGCILYIMVAGRHPFDMMGSSSEDEIVHRVLTTDKVSFLHPVWSSVPSSVKSLIRGLLEKDPSARLSVEEVLAHPALHPTA
jgi:serine/threonine protein kinase